MRPLPMICGDNVSSAMRTEREDFWPFSIPKILIPERWCWLGKRRSFPYLSERIRRICTWIGYRAMPTTWFGWIGTRGFFTGFPALLPGRNWFGLRRAWRNERSRRPWRSTGWPGRLTGIRRQNAPCGKIEAMCFTGMKRAVRLPWPTGGAQKPPAYRSPPLWAGRWRPGPSQWTALLRTSIWRKRRRQGTLWFGPGTGCCSGWSPPVPRRSWPPWRRAWRFCRWNTGSPGCRRAMSCICRMIPSVIRSRSSTKTRRDDCCISWFSWTVRGPGRIFTPTKTLRKNRCS